MASAKERQIEQIAWIAAEAIIDVDWTVNDIVDFNSKGWTVELSDLENDSLVVRYEGVVLTADELDRAIEMAVKMAAAEWAEG